jgi:hypothetical protein
MVISQVNLGLGDTWTQDADQRSHDSVLCYGAATLHLIGQPNHQWSTPLALNPSGNHKIHRELAVLSRHAPCLLDELTSREA